MNIPATSQALKEALSLSEELLRQIELSELPLASLALRCSRLARLLNDFDFAKIMEYESSGYPSTAGGVEPEVYKHAVLAGREYETKDAKTDAVSKYIYTQSIDAIEGEISAGEISLASAADPDVSVSSSNPNQMVFNPTGNKLERDGIRNNMFKNRQHLASRRTLIYSYVLKKHYELKYSGIVDDVFSRTRETLDAKIGDHVPNAVKMFTAVYENLRSDNSENWANAVHSCRRILQELADKLYPARADEEKIVDGKKKSIKLGSDNYINRLVAFIESRSTSERYNDIVGSHLKYIGDRLDASFEAAQKGSHSTVSKTEADRYVVFTYLLVGDILSLID